MSEDVILDAMGRFFCRHSRSLCMECQLDFRELNEDAEERERLRKAIPRSAVVATATIRPGNSDLDQLAESVAAQMLFDYGSNNHNGNVGFQQQAAAAASALEEMLALQREIEQIERGTVETPPLEEEGDPPMCKMVKPPRKTLEEKKKQRQQERMALQQAWKKKNGNDEPIAFGKKETQELFEKFVAPPKVNTSKRVDVYTCGHCHRISRTVLMTCSRCHKASYCGRQCQKLAWKQHKKECRNVSTLKSPPKSLPLTWEQVFVFNGEPVMGKTLEVRAILDQSAFTRQVFQCKDRAGDVRLVAAYTDTGMIPGLCQGAILKWKNPRFHRFLDGNTGARIEECDLANIFVKPPPIE